jgi:hypothetical protein
VNVLKILVVEQIKLMVNKTTMNNTIVKHLVEVLLIDYNFPLNDVFDVKPKKN